MMSLLFFFLLLFFVFFLSFHYFVSLIFIEFLVMFCFYLLSVFFYFMLGGLSVLFVGVCLGAYGVSLCLFSSRHSGSVFSFGPNY